MNAVTEIVGARVVPQAGRGLPPEHWLDALAERVVSGLTSAERTIAVAESLTGGAVSGRLTDVPGAAAVLRGGVVAYATELKAELLGVDAALLASVGAVHPQVAREMAEGVRRRLGADIGAATTGVAGPSSQDGRPPGTLHVAVAWDGGSWVRSTMLAGTRTAVRQASTGLVLALVIGAIERGTADAVAEQPGASPR
jgi:nicotinamide-nucleotide amidase